MRARRSTRVMRKRRPLAPISSSLGGSAVLRHRERLPFAVDLLTDGQPGTEKHHVRIGLDGSCAPTATSVNEMAN